MVVKMIFCLRKMVTQMSEPLELDFSDNECGDAQDFEGFYIPIYLCI